MMTVEAMRSHVAGLVEQSKIPCQFVPHGEGVTGQYFKNPLGNYLTNLMAQTQSYTRIFTEEPGVTIAEYAFSLRLPEIVDASTYAEAMHELGHAIGHHSLESFAWEWAASNMLVWNEETEDFARLSMDSYGMGEPVLTEFMQQLKQKQEENHAA